MNYFNEVKNLVSKIGCLEKVIVFGKVYMLKKFLDDIIYQFENKIICQDNINILTRMSNNYNNDIIDAVVCLKEITLGEYNKAVLNNIIYKRSIY